MSIVNRDGCINTGIFLQNWCLTFLLKMVQEKTNNYRDSFVFIVLTALIVTVMYSFPVGKLFSRWTSPFTTMKLTNQTTSFSLINLRKLAESSYLKKAGDQHISKTWKRIPSDVILENNQTKDQHVTSFEINNVTTKHGDHDWEFEKTDYTTLKCPKERSVPGHRLPKIALASFPRSGNGWTRRLIQYATGLYVGSYGWIKMKGHHPNMETFKATAADVQNGRVVIIKTHSYPTAELQNETVLLIRNPYKAIVSDVYHRILVRKKFSKNGMKRFFKTEKWKKEAYTRASAWKNFALQWIDKSKRLLVVQNERLFENTEEELERVIDFIHQPLNKKRLRCAVKVNYPTTFGDRFSIDPYTDEMRNVLDSCIKEVNDTLVRHGFEPIPTYQKFSSY